MRFGAEYQRSEIAPLYMLPTDVFSPMVHIFTFNYTDMRYVKTFREFWSGFGTVFSRKEKLYFISLTGLFIFLFLLFFQPFGVNNYNPRETISPQFFFAMLLIGLCSSLLLLLSEFFLIPFLRKYLRIKAPLAWGASSILLLSTGIFLLYNLLGGWHDFVLGSYLQFIGNVAALAFLPFAALHLYGKIRNLKQSLDVATTLAPDTDSQLVFVADNQKERLSLSIKDLLYIASDDNYISVYYVQDDIVAKTLVRKSLKSVQEEGLHPALIRCHRSYIVNMLQLHHVKGNRNKLEIFLNRVKGPLPVSRQYVDDLYQLLPH